MQRVAVLGLDGVDFQTFNLILRRYNTPNLQYLFSKSLIKGSIKCLPPITPPSWTSIFTGVPPEVHGIPDFLVVDSAHWRARAVTIRDIRYPRIWDIAKTSRNSLIVLVGVPLSYPPLIRRRDLLIVGDWTSLYSNTLRIPSIVKVNLKPIKYKSVVSQEYETFLKYSEEELENYLDIMEKIIHTHYVNLLITVIPHLDWILHKWPYSLINGVPDLKQIIETIDRISEVLLEEFDNIFLCSDHGVKPFRYVLNIVGILAKYRLLKFTGNIFINWYFSLNFPRIIYDISKFLISSTRIPIIKLMNKMHLKAEMHTLRGYVDKDSICATSSYPYWIYIRRRTYTPLVIRVLRKELNGLITIHKIKKISNIGDLLIEPKSREVCIKARYIPSYKTIIKFNTVDHSINGFYSFYSKNTNHSNVKKSDITTNVDLGIFLKSFIRVDKYLFKTFILKQRPLPRHLITKE